MYKEIPIETKIREILDILEGKQYLTFSEIAKIQTSRAAMVVCFMAVLELVKNKQVVAKQSELFEDIRIYRVYNTEESDESIVKEEKDELSLDIEQNITEETVEEFKQEDRFELEAESVNSENKEPGDNDGNQ